ncbi:MULTISPECIES: GMC family oxidoreductase [unclassified Rhizobacter]|uniref:GMC family oxidoreductase n=1 Tax=unclassified Rhizobacter TaxID=2640088 RepID=UPI0006FAAAD3|nr:MULTISPECIES: GMC family oxidoreductase N-terminal domain-containing protein [unclassified Rhizobacter]KQU77947.1 choline dehydrogenase [Rhizobacter sp. Root29]KQW15694.1 choline dehydrogenase [Rhizobacter sp. Root1238]KRB24804.1 choline dehydrogenase [Rhizobacter sp. Root16D2]
MSEITYDYIVCGAGTAGCLLANRLSADPTKSVLLIEAGGNDDYLWIHIPVGYLYCIGNPRTDWLYHTDEDPGLNGRSLRYPRGKVLGGSSSINGMIYMRGQARDYDHWGALGNPGWSWRECLPFFKQHEDFHKGADEFHAAPGFDRSGQRAGGEWRVEKQRLRWDILDAFAQAAQQAGIPHSNDFNRGDNEGVGYFDVNQRHGIRWNAAKAFLRPVLRRPNLQVWTGAQIARLLIEPGPSDGSWDGMPQASGVEVIPQGGGERVRARAAREVILCTGAVGTPQLLQLSGIGPRALLQQHGVMVMRDAPGVGGNLQDHLQIRAVYEVDGVRTLNAMANSLWGKAMIGAEYLLRRSGPMSMAPSQLGAFTRSDPSQPHANLQYHVQPLSLDAFGQPLHRFNAFTASVCNLNPTSRGRIDIRSADAAAAPSIRANYLGTDEDRRVAAASLRVTRRIVAQPALAPYHPKEIKPGVQFESDDELARLAGDIGTTIFHPVGTAKMGPASDPDAVVDAQLRVHGVKRLRVADASVMPAITSGNTNAPTLMIAERAAHWIRAEATGP